MSELTYINYEGAGQANSDMCHYSQAVIIGDIVKASGQGGWDNAGNVDANDAKGQVDFAFENVDKALRAVGLRHWEDVFSVRSYHRDIETTFPIVVEKPKSVFLVIGRFGPMFKLSGSLSLGWRLKSRQKRIAGESD
ncbi:L-PSP endoribonuclease family protein, partial [Rhizoctonia solani AG-3 Rhs1AP]